MNWWKRALVISMIWTALIALGAFVMVRHIKTAAESPAHAEAWENRMSETAGLLFGAGHVAIWVVAWNLERRNLK